LFTKNSFPLNSIEKPFFVAHNALKQTTCLWRLITKIFKTFQPTLPHFMTS